LCRLRGAEEAELHEEIEKLRREAIEHVNHVEHKCADKEDTEWGFKRIWKTRSVRSLFICCVVLHIGNQLSGINAVNVFDILTE